MKRITIYLIFCFPFALFGQHLIPDFPKYHGNIETVIMNSMNDYYYDTLSMTYEESDISLWKTEYEFLENNKLSRRISYYNNEIRSEKIYEYDTIGVRIFKKEIINDYGNSILGDYSLDEYIYATEKREKIIRLNTWYYNHKIDTLELCGLTKDIRYDSLNNLKSFNHFLINYKGDTIISGIYELSYDTLNQLIYYDEMAYDSMTIMAKSDTSDMYRFKKIPIQEPVLLNRIRYHYNENGLMYKNVHELNAKEFYLTDEGYSNYYEFDEKNNWIRLYRMWESQTDYILKLERKIIYK